MRMTTVLSTSTRFRLRTLLFFQQTVLVSSIVACNTSIIVCLRLTASAMPHLNLRIAKTNRFDALRMRPSLPLQTLVRGDQILHRVELDKAISQIAMRARIDRHVQDLVSPYASAPSSAPTRYDHVHHSKEAFHRTSIRQVPNHHNRSLVFAALKLRQVHLFAHVVRPHVVVGTTAVMAAVTAITSIITSIITTIITTIITISVLAWVVVIRRIVHCIGVSIITLFTRRDGLDVNARTRSRGSRRNRRIRRRKGIAELRSRCARGQYRMGNASVLIMERLR